MEAAGVDRLHFDFMDGHYVPNIALAPTHLESIRPLTDLPLEVHLELSNPDELLDSFRPFPADMIILQWDTCPDPEASIARVRARQATIGIGLLPLMDVGPILPLLGQIEMLLLLGVQPGFGGQQMIEGTLGWLEGIASERDRVAPHLPISVDGGVKAKNAPDLVRAGADVLIMGSGLFGRDEIVSLVPTLQKLQRSI